MLVCEVKKIDKFGKKLVGNEDADTIIDVERFNVIPIVSGDSIKKEK